MDFLLYALAIATIVATVTRGSVFKFCRNTNFTFLDQLLYCPYCLAHWVSVPFAVMLAGLTWYAIPVALGLVAASSLPTFLLIRYMGWLDVN